MTRRKTLVLAAASGVGVGNIYFVQALTPLIAADLRVGPGTAAAVVTATQAGYTVGICLVAPLGDRFCPRRLALTLFTLSGVALAVAGSMPDVALLAAAASVVGITSVGVQVLAAAAAGMAPDARRGTVLGVLLGGSIGGMLLARGAAGVLGEWLGWRAPYAVAAAVTLVATLALMVALRGSPAARSNIAYPRLVAEPLRLLAVEPELRRSCIYQALGFASFTAFWTAAALLLSGPAYGLGASAVGLLALVGAATIVCAPLAGRQVDRLGADTVNAASMLGLLAAAAVLTVGAAGGTVGLTALIAGALILDVAMQSGMVANSVRIFGIRPETRSRMNTAYMTCAYFAGTIGSLLGAQTYRFGGWPAVCALMALLAALSLGHLTVDRCRRPRAARGIPAPERG